MAKLNATKGRLGRVDDIIRFIKQLLICNPGNDVAKCSCDYIEQVYSQWAL